MRGNMLAGIPRATQLRARELVIPSAAAAAVSQMLTTVARLGGRAYIPWSPAISPAYYGNSDGAGGVPGVGGAVGLLLDSSNGWGFAGPELIPAPVESSLAGWSTSGTPSAEFTGGVVRVTASPVNGGYFRDFTVPAGSQVSVRYRISQITVVGGAFFLYDGASFVTTLFAGDAVTASQTTAPIVTCTTGILRVYLFARGNGPADFSQVSVRAISSPLANALTQPTGINKPLLASGAVPWAGALVFDAADDVMASATIAGTAQETLISAFRPSVINFCDIIARGAAGAGAGSITMRLQNNGNLQANGFDGTNPQQANSGGGSIVVNQTYVATVIKAAATVRVRVNGVQTSGGGAVGAQAVPTAITSGAATSASAFFGGAKFGDIWVPSEASAADLAVLERGAAAIAGLPI
jgi:hypothetical protein